MKLPEHSPYKTTRDISETSPSSSWKNTQMLFVLLLMESIDQKCLANGIVYEHQIAALGVKSQQGTWGQQCRRKHEKICQIDT